MTDKRTKIIQAEIGSDPAYGSVTAPLYMVFGSFKEI
jgi:hypothetical protein